MTDYPDAIPLLAIERLRCPKCRARMMLARTSPTPSGFELRTFDCSKCGHVEQIVMALDPLKSGDMDLVSRHRRLHQIAGSRMVFVADVGDGQSASGKNA